MKQKERQDTSVHNPLKKERDRSETSSQGRHAHIGGVKSSKSVPKAKADTSHETTSSSKNMEASESLTSTMNKMSLTGEAETSRDIKSRSARSKSNHKPEEWMLLDKESDILTQLNLAIVSFLDYYTDFFLSLMRITDYLQSDCRLDMLIQANQRFQVDYCIY